MKMNNKREKRESVLHLGTHCDEREASVRALSKKPKLNNQVTVLEFQEKFEDVTLLRRSSHFAYEDAGSISERPSGMDLQRGFTTESAFVCIGLESGPPEGLGVFSCRGIQFHL